MRVLIDRYIARLIVWPLTVTLAVSAMLLLIVRMVDLSALLIDQGGTFTTLLQVLSELIPQYLALGIPVGLLMGVLLAFRQLTLGRELDAMLGSGVSYARLLRVPLLYAGALSFITLIVVGFIQPLSNYGYEKLRFEVESGALGIPVKVGEFTALGDHLVIRARESHHGGRDLVGVFATNTGADGKLEILSAERAELLPTADRDTVIARLTNGTVARVDPADGSNNLAAFTTYDVHFTLPDLPMFRARGNHEREMTFFELIETVGDTTVSENMHAQAEAGLYRRLSQALAIFFLPFLGIALARPPMRSTSGVGLFIALALFIVYNELSLFAERLGFTGQSPPLPFQAALLVGFGALSMLLFALSAFNAGESLVGRIFGLGRGVVDIVRRHQLADAQAAPAGE
jgi:lipopolysaccharide export system permease protein